MPTYSIPQRLIEAQKSLEQAKKAVKYSQRLVKLYNRLNKIALPKEEVLWTTVPIKDGNSEAYDYQDFADSYRNPEQAVKILNEIQQIRLSLSGKEVETGKKPNSSKGKYLRGILPS
jgi:hypothetical protein